MKITVVLNFFLSSLLCTSMINPLLSFYTLCGWKQEDIFLKIISIFCVDG